MSANLSSTLRACEALRDSTRSANAFMLDNISPNGGLVDALSQILSSCTDSCDRYIHDIRTNLNLQSYALTVFFEDADAVVKGIAKKLQAVVDSQEVAGGKEKATGDEVLMFGDEEAKQLLEELHHVVRRMEYSVGPVLQKQIDFLEMRMVAVVQNADANEGRAEERFARLEAMMAEVLAEVKQLEKTD